MKKIFVCTIKFDPANLSFAYTKKIFDVISDNPLDSYYGVALEHSDTKIPTSYFPKTMVTTNELRIEYFTATGTIYQKYYLYDETIPQTTVALCMDNTVNAVREAFNKDYKAYINKVINLAKSFAEINTPTK